MALSSPFNLMITELSNMVNKTQYFNPFFSWIIVVYTYFSIGIQGGKIWKYLFYFATCGYIASFLNIIYTLAKTLNLDYVKYLQLLWIEHCFWGINEWGYMFVNFLKIKACINKLNKKVWDCLLYFLLAYTLVIRIVIAHTEITGRVDVYINNKKTGKNDKFDDSILNYFNGALYFPLGILCTVFIFLIFQKFITEDNNESRNVLSVLLHSTLSRMIFVSSLFIGISIIVFFPSTGVSGFIRRLLWRIKGNLGIIFLVDIILLRIDLDKNKIIEQTRQIQMMNKNKTIQNGFNFDPSERTSQNVNMNMEYTNRLLTNKKNVSGLYKSLPLDNEIRDDVLPYLNHNSIEGCDISKSHNYNGSGSLGRYPYSNNTLARFSRNSKVSDNMNTSNLFGYYSVSLTNFEDNNNSLLRKPHNNHGFETISLNGPSYSSLSHLNPNSINLENIASSSISSNYGSLSRTQSVKAPSISNGSLKRKHPGDIIMENPNLE